MKSHTPSPFTSAAMVTPAGVNSRVAQPAVEGETGRSKRSETPLLVRVTL
jgi:hypothetical protein